MTRLFLAAGVAALAISAPAGAQRDNDRQRDREAKAERAERPQRAQAQRPQRAERTERAQVEQRAERRVERPQRAQRVERAEATQRVERRAERPQRMERAQAERRVERQMERPQRAERVQADRQQRIQRVERQAVAERTEQRVDRRSDRIANRVDGRLAERQQARAQRIDRIDTNVGARIDDRIARAQVRNTGYARRIAAFRDASTTWDIAPRARGRALIDGCPPGLWLKNNDCLPPGQAAKFLGAPLSTVAGITTLSALPRSLNYLYPDTDDYYYRYGDGYLYQVDRSDNLILSLLPLIAGGFIPGQYLPASYMNSYVPNYYGLSSFYQDSPYGCNRYYDGVVYQVDCVTGMIEGVVPLYASGYGVGQMLPSAYSYYNVPTQYRSLYYDNDDYGYWYAPGAIYQYDNDSSLITSVAALLSPGFTLGQTLPMGYNTYNVPYAYRTNYYDTQNDWYRYNNGYIYRVDPTTQLVTAIVASILT
jgi:hypothetical protein